MRIARASSIIAAAALAVGVILAPTMASAAPTSSTAPNITDPSASSVAHPNLDPGTIGLCNAGFGDVSVQNFQAKNLGKIDLFCGDSASGYVHIRTRHQSDWQTVINQAGGGALWDDFMVYAVNGSVSAPSPNYPVNIGNNKWCYTTPIQIKNTQGVVTKTLHPTVIVSVNNKKVITAFPTTTAPNCNGD